MRVNLECCGLAAVLTACVGGCCRPGSWSKLNVEHRAQETDMWCWAACAEMIMAYKDLEVTQCRQAADFFGYDCPCDQCGSGHLETVLCSEVGGWPDFEEYGFSWKRTSNEPLSWKRLKKELSTNSRCGGSPVAFTLREGEAAHMYVAFGYSEAGGTKMVDVWDPAPTCEPGVTRALEEYYGLWTYDDYVGDDHWHDFYRIRKD